jgi:hypothetical protein
MIKKTPGNFSIEGNKLRIKSSAGISSVLFEDISSISFRTIEVPDWSNSFIIISISVLLFVFGLQSNPLPNAPSNGGTIQLATLLFIIALILPFFIRKRWENVIIETRGGMLLSFSVQIGEGINQVNRIEEEKRKITGVNEGNS